MNNIYENLIHKKEKITVFGVGYVGLQLAYEFSKKINVIGFDNDDKKILQYKNNNDITNEIGNNKIKKSNIFFTSNILDTIDSSCFIVTVPTPVKNDKSPDLSFLVSATKAIGEIIKKQSIIIYESTVYPGTTEEICIDILEKESGLKCGQDFLIGYSPERLEPGVNGKKINEITKLVSGINNESLKVTHSIYSIITNNIYDVNTIKEAESSKILENVQRDVNIALMNEFSIIFDKLNIDTNSVINAASTKFNFNKYYPGLVGGHCISIDPYYMMYKAKINNINMNIIETARSINENVSEIIKNKITDMIIINNCKNNHVCVFGLTFKENCSDIRNSKSYDIIKKLKALNINVDVVDNMCNKNEVKKIYGINLIDIQDVKNIDVAIITVAHDEFKNIDICAFDKMFASHTKIIIDVKGIYNKHEFLNSNYKYWRM